MTPTPATAIMECDDLLDPTVRGPGVPFTADLCTGGNVTFVAGTRRGDFVDPSLVRTRAQSRAEIGSPRVRGPFTAGCEYSVVTVMRTAALPSKPTRSPAAYGDGKLIAEPHAQPQLVTPTLRKATSSQRQRKSAESSRCRCPCDIL